MITKTANEAFQKAMLSDSTWRRLGLILGFGVGAGYGGKKLYDYYKVKEKGDDSIPEPNRAERYVMKVLDTNDLTKSATTLNTTIKRTVANPQLKSKLQKNVKKPESPSDPKVTVNPKSTKTAAKLTSKIRKNLGNSDFAIPELRKYPIHDIGHARSALAMVSKYGTPEQKKRVRIAVASRYPKLA